MIPRQLFENHLHCQTTYLLYYHRVVFYISFLDPSLLAHRKNHFLVVMANMLITIVTTCNGKNLQTFVAWSLIGFDMLWH